MLLLGLDGGRVVRQCECSMMRGWHRERLNVDTRQETVGLFDEVRRQTGQRVARLYSSRTRG